MYSRFEFCSPISWVNAWLSHCLTRVIGDDLFTHVLCAQMSMEQFDEWPIWVIALSGNDLSMHLYRALSTCLCVFLFQLCINFSKDTTTLEIYEPMSREFDKQTKLVITGTRDETASDRIVKDTVEITQVPTPRLDFDDVDTSFSMCSWIYWLLYCPICRNLLCYSCKYCDLCISYGIITTVVLLFPINSNGSNFYYECRSKVWDQRRVKKHLL